MTIPGWVDEWQRWADTGQISPVDHPDFVIAGDNTHEVFTGWRNIGEYRMAEPNRHCLDRDGRPIRMSPEEAAETNLPGDIAAELTTAQLDAIGIDLPRDAYLTRWTRAVEEFAVAVSVGMAKVTAAAQKTMQALNAFGRPAPDRHHPAPIPRGRGMAYARRHR